MSLIFVFLRCALSSSFPCFLFSHQKSSQGKTPFFIFSTHFSSKCPVVGSNTGPQSSYGISMNWTQGSGSAAGADWVSMEMDRMRKTMINILNIFVVFLSLLVLFEIDWGPHKYCPPIYTQAGHIWPQFDIIWPLLDNNWPAHIYSLWKWVDPKPLDPRSSTERDIKRETERSKEERDFRS